MIPRTGLRQLAEDPPTIDCVLCGYSIPEWKKGVCLTYHDILVLRGLLREDIPAETGARSVVAQPGGTPAPAPSPDLALGRRRPGPEVSG